MQIWEYKVVSVRYSVDWENELNSLGEQGWEMVSIQETFFFFKRPIP